MSPLIKEQYERVVTDLNCVSDYLHHVAPTSKFDEDLKKRTFDYLIRTETWAYNKLSDNSMHQLNILRRCKRLLNHPLLDDVQYYTLK